MMPVLVSSGRKALRRSLLASMLLLIGLAPARAEAECREDDVCSGGPARIMLLIDASSDMLNVGNEAGAMGTTDWDLLREVLADDPSSLWDVEVQPGGPVASQVVHFGAIAFGSPEQEKLLVDYGPCTQQNVDWALDPNTSCEAPGCTDPWGGPPISWTLKDGSDIDPPGFVRRTLSHMPACEGTGQVCTGSGRAVHRGIGLATQNRDAYRDNPPFLHDATTDFHNILFVSGSFAADATEDEVRTALEAAYASGTVTHVVGFGPLAATGDAAFEAELQSLADWGSGGALQPYVASNESALRAAVADIIAKTPLPCCRTIDCSQAGGADGGGGDGGADDGDTASSWGSADGGGSASADGGDADGGGDGPGAGPAGAGAIDDDGGCTCRSSSGTAAPWLGLLVLLGLRVRRRARR